MAYVINAMEYFLSSVINANFSEALSAEFVANIRVFDLTQQDINGAVYNAELIMYPHRPENYFFSKNDGSINLQAVLVTLHRSKESYGPNEKKISTKGFDKGIVTFIYEVFREDGILQLSRKITKIQADHNCFIKYDAGAINTNFRADADNILLETMIKIVEVLNPEVFYSEKFHEIRSWNSSTE